MREFSRRKLIQSIAVLAPLWPLTGFSLAAAKPPMMSGKISIATKGGTKAEGILAMPEHVPAPAILLLHEWRGLTSQIMAEAANFSMMGYIVLAADLYGGQVADTAKEAMDYQNAIGGDTLKDIVISWLAWLMDHPDGTGKVGAVGFGLGGELALLGALALPVSATVVFYGGADVDADRLFALKGPVLGHFANNDESVSRAAVSWFEAGMKKAGKDAAIYFYEAPHSFFNFRDQRYDDDAARLSGQRTLSFLKQNLGGEHTREGSLPRTGRY